MSNTQTKKRKIVDEHRNFQERWKFDYFFTIVKDKAVCLLCSETVAVLKEYNIKRHYKTKHEDKYKNLTGQLRIDKVNQEEKNLKKQHSIFKNQEISSHTAVKASFVISQILAKKMKPFADGDMVKDCLTAVAEIAFPDKLNIISNISLSRFTVAKRIDDLSENIAATLRERIAQFEYCSLALDESCDISDTAQLAIFIRGVDTNFNITEELCSLVPMRGATTGKDLYEKLKSVLENFSISLKKIVSVSTDGAPAMSSMNVAGRLFQDIKDATGEEIFINHCMIHQESLCAKKLTLPHVTIPVIKLINFIKSRGLNHREFKEFLNNLESEYGDVIFNTEVRWLSRTAMLKRVYDLKTEIELFAEKKEYAFPHFHDKEWMCDFAFLIDITQHLNHLNVELQGKGQFIHNFYDKIQCFECKLKLWRKHLLQNNVSHFPYLEKENANNTQKYIQYVDILINEFQLRFFKMLRTEKIAMSIKMFSSPFNIDVDEVQANCQMEIINLQNNSEMKNVFFSVNIENFYKFHISSEKFPCLKKNAMKMMSLFGSTYVCEQLFSTMKFVKNDHRSNLGDTRLESCLRVATSSIPADIDQIVSKKQCQISH
ncbi:general transcription factor II-I repeat domain-containing protein 2B-like [Ctenocephalides felis]|uniref:general transcription factor II-I repeat domain-containing protein 2B-like n=1 Tax=Ctenocephalides felis TaxID=7515 RepID=UPI000E6E4D8A|nr:general transcription factor II-I repeat domain-containing protein 2B-like [Ctenocephalides felis]